MEESDNPLIPTVTGSRKEGGQIVLETLDPKQETDLVSIEGEGLVEYGKTLTVEQQDKLALRRGEEA